MVFDFDNRQVKKSGQAEISIVGLVSGFFGLEGPSIEFDLDEDFDVPEEKPKELSRQDLYMQKIFESQVSEAEAESMFELLQREYFDFDVNLSLLR